MDPFVCDDGGRETSRTFGNSLVTTTSYITGENLIDTLSTSGVAGFDYAYDANENRTAETVTGALSASSWTTGSSGFDADDRLIERNQDSGTLLEEWDLSDVGDWDTFTVNSTPQSRTHGDAHEILTVGAASIAHDSRGNIVTDEAGRLFGWDADNRLASVDVDADTTPDVTWAWDALMRRVSMTRGGTTLVFVSQGDDLLAEYASGTAAGSPQRKYVYGSRIDQPLAMIDASDTHYYHADGHTSIRAITDSSGNVEELYRYTSYGAPTILEPGGTTTRTSSAVNNRFLFTAREFDDATTSTATQQTGWYHFRNRPYSAALGRFPGRDSLEYIDGESLYRAYFIPNGTDPKGTHTASDCRFTKRVLDAGCQFEYDMCMIEAGGSWWRELWCNSVKVGCNDAAAANYAACLATADETLKCIAAGIAAGATAACVAGKRCLRLVPKGPPVIMPPYWDPQDGA